MTPDLSIRSFAKINLILRVAPPQTDGYHPICSWMHPIDLSDQISITQVEGDQSEFIIRWDTGEPVDWPIESDLVFRAHAIFEQMTGHPLPVQIQINKTIPAGGGLGGGSSNAASVMMGLNQLFELGLDEQQLRTVGHELGTDIPYFMDLESFNTSTPPRPAVVSGIGDRITRTDRVQNELTLLIPSFGCPTGRVYQTFDAIEFPEPIDDQFVLNTACSGLVDAEFLVNDLCEPACQAVPELGKMMTTLNDLGIDVQLSGSGSTMYVPGVIDPLVINRLTSIFPNLQIHQTRLV